MITVVMRASVLTRAVWELKLAASAAAAAAVVVVVVVVVVTAAASVVVTATARLVQARQEGVSHGLLQVEALGRVVRHHLLHHVEKVLVVFALTHHVLLREGTGRRC